MRETPVLFGHANSLAGIVTEPDAAAEGRPAVLLMNAGLLPRVGPSRVYVRLARALASAGYVVLRFDYSGIGDSAKRTDDLPRPEGVLRETREALEFLAESRGAHQFVPMGLCWGATNAFRIACDDRRVVGAVMLDWCAYRTLGYYVRRYGRRLFKVTPYYNFLTGRNPAGRGLRRMLGIGGVQPLGNPIGVSYVRSFPPKQVVAGELRGLTERGVDLLFIYSAGQEYVYNYRGQFEDTFPWLRSNERVRVEFFGGADHTFTLLRYQDALVSVIEDFARTVLARLNTGVPGDAGSKKRDPSLVSSAGRTPEFHG